MINRRKFLKFLSPLLAIVALPIRAAASRKEDCLVFRGETVSVFNRDGTEIIVSGGSREYNSRDVRIDRYVGKRPFISWNVNVVCLAAFSGVVSKTFYGVVVRVHVLL